jgi:hypothetical protein
MINLEVFYYTRTRPYIKRDGMTHACRRGRRERSSITYPNEAVVEEETDEAGANAGVRAHGLPHGIPDDPVRARAPVAVVAVSEP